MVILTSHPLLPLILAIELNSQNSRSSLALTGIYQFASGRNQSVQSILVFAAPGSEQSKWRQFVELNPMATAVGRRILSVVSDFSIPVCYSI